MSPKNNTQESAKSTTSSGKKSQGFTDAEKEAMKERAKELKAEARASKDKEAGENAVLEKIAGMPEPDRILGQRIHELVKANAPDLTPKLWYGMPAYARDGKIVCYFQSADKFKSRYATLGFDETAKLDDGDFWPTSYALTKLTPANEAKMAALIKKAVS